MDSRTLLIRLMERDGVNPTSLSRRLEDHSLQSQIKRFLDGKTRSPRALTFQPIAEMFGVDVASFLSDEAAARTAKELGLSDAEGRASALPLEPARRRRSYAPRDTADVLELITALAEMLATQDSSARRAIGTLLEGLANNPGDANITASRIKALIEAPGNGSRQRSTGSP